MTSAEFQELIATAGGRVVIDLGTGDGLFPYRSARANKGTFYIGIDANLRPLEKISEKACRKPSKGGAPNVLYLQASAENLPEELNGIAEEVYVLYPWGSLLGGVLSAEDNLIGSLKRICKPEAKLRTVIAIDPQRDRGELQRLGLFETPLNVRSKLIPRYREAGLEFITDQPFEFETTWAKKLRHNNERTTIYLTFCLCASAPPLP